MPQVETAPLSQHRAQIWPQKWLRSVFWLKPCLEPWAYSYVKLVHKDEHELINADTSSDVNRVIFMGESLPRAMPHQRPPSLSIFPKSWCSVIKSSHCTRAIWQQRTFVKGGSASARRVACHTGKLSPSCAGDKTHSGSVVATSAPRWWHPKNTATHFSNKPTQLWGADT